MRTRTGAVPVPGPAAEAKPLQVNGARGLVLARPVSRFVFGALPLRVVLLSIPDGAVEPRRVAAFEVAAFGSLRLDAFERRKL